MSPAYLPIFTAMLNLLSARVDSADPIEWNKLFEKSAPYLHFMPFWTLTWTVSGSIVSAFCATHLFPGCILFRRSLSTRRSHGWWCQNAQKCSPDRVVVGCQSTPVSHSHSAPQQQQPERHPICRERTGEGTSGQTIRNQNLNVNFTLESNCILSGGRSNSYESDGRRAVTGWKFSFFSLACLHFTLRKALFVSSSVDTWSSGRAGRR